MDTDPLSRLAVAPVGWTWGLTIASCVLVAVSALTGELVFITLLAVVVPLTLAAAIQTTAVAPLASEVVRLRAELARTKTAAS